MLNVTCMREIYIFRGSVSFLMFKIHWTQSIISTAVSGLLRASHLYLIMINWLTKFEMELNKHAKVWNIAVKRANTFPKHISAEVFRFSNCVHYWFFTPIWPDDSFSPVNVWHMAILKETNVWFILIVVFAYMKPPEFSDNVQRVCAAAVWKCSGFTGGSAHVEPKTCSTFCREPRSSLDVEFAFLY